MRPKLSAFRLTHKTPPPAKYPHPVEGTYLATCTTSAAEDPDCLLDERADKRLDVEALDALEHDVFAHYVSCLLVSHAPTFLRNVGNRFWWGDSPEAFLQGEMDGAAL
ncbi:MAG: hypothetical protein ACSHXD_17115 [Marinosulfonomonas sp.]